MNIAKFNCAIASRSGKVLGGGLPLRNDCFHGAKAQQLPIGMSEKIDYTINEEKNGTEGTGLPQNVQNYANGTAGNLKRHSVIQHLRHCCAQTCSILILHILTGCAHFPVLLAVLCEAIKSSVYALCPEPGKLRSYTRGVHTSLCKSLQNDELAPE